jgi:hypothetical protein
MCAATDYKFGPKKGEKMSAAKSIRVPDPSTTVILLGIGLVIGFAVTRFQYETKIGECEDLAAQELTASRAQQGLAFAECFRPGKYAPRPK